MKSIASKLYQRVSLFALAAIVAISGLSAVTPFLFSQTASALSNTVITPNAPGSWTTDDTRPGGAVSFATDAAAPAGVGALKLTTNNTTAAKAQYTQYFTPVGLSGVGSDLSYYTKQNAGTAFAGGDPAYQLYVHVNGSSDGATDFDTFTYEPYINQGTSAIHQGDWQQWDVANGLFYSSHNFTGPGGSIQTSQGTYTYTLAQLKADFPSATVVGVGVNIGTGNPSYNVETDELTFNGTTYDFEPIVPNLSITPTANSVISGTKTFTVTSDTTNPGYMYVELNTGGAHGTWIAANTGNGNSTSLTYDTNNLSDGTYTIKVDAIESNGNSQEKLFNYVVDHAAPSGVVVTPINVDGTSVVNGTVPFAISATDPNYSYSYLEVNKNGTWITDDTHGTSSYSGSTLHWNWDSTTVADGTYTLKADAIDKAGNTTEQNINFTVDNTAPAVPTLVSPADGIYRQTSNSNYSQWSAVTDPHGPVTYYYESAFDAAFTNIAYPAHALSGTSILNPGEPEGTYYWHVKACDALGNCSAWSGPWTIHIDNTAPTITVNTLLTNDPTPQVTGTVNDPTATIQVIVNGQTYSATNNGSTWTANVTHHTNDGIYDVQASATDAAHNIGNDATTNELTVDAHPAGAPTLVTPGNNDYTNNHTVGFLWLPPLFVAHGPLTYHLQLSTDPSFGSTIVDHTGTSLFLSQSLADGIYYVRVMDIDSLGGTSGWTTHKFTVDTLKPVVAIATPSDGAVKNGTITLSGSATDVNPDSYTWTIKNSANHTIYVHTYHQISVSPYDWNTAGVADGTYTISLKATDAAGNSGTVSVQVVVDNSAPTGLQNLSPSDGTVATAANSTSIDWTDASDPHGVTYYYESSNSSATNGDGSFTSPVYQSGALTDSNIPTPGTPEGIYYWHVRAVDNLGNSTSWTAPWKLIVDNTAPTDPGTPTTTTPTNSDNSTWTWNSSIDANGIKQYHYTLTDGSANVIDSGITTNPTVNETVAADGTYTLSVYAEDNAGNLSNVVSGSVVVDTTAPVVHITSPHDGDVVHGVNVTIIGTVTDVNPDHYYLVVKDSNGLVVAGPGTVNQATVSDWNWDTTAVADGTYTIDLEARDAAQNKDTGSVQTITVVVDNDAPTVTINSFAQTGNVFQPTVTATDDSTTALTYAWTTTASNSDVTISDPTIAEPTFTVHNDGTYTFKLVVTDASGNASAAQSLTFTYSTPAAPAFTNVTNGSNTVADNGAGVLGATTDTPSSDTNGSTGVQGATDTKVAAAATNTNGTIFGLAWYWWLLILAALAAIVWWIIGAVRRRNQQEN